MADQTGSARRKDAPFELGLLALLGLGLYLWLRPATSAEAAPTNEGLAASGITPVDGGATGPLAATNLERTALAGSLQAGLGFPTYSQPVGTPATVQTGARIVPALYAQPAVIQNGVQRTLPTSDSQNYAALVGATAAIGTGVTRALTPSAAAAKAAPGVVRTSAPAAAAPRAAAAPSGGTSLQSAQTVAKNLPVKQVYQAVTTEEPYVPPSAEEVQSTQALEEQMIPQPEYGAPGSVEEAAANIPPEGSDLGLPEVSQAVDSAQAADQVAAVNVVAPEQIQTTEDLMSLVSPPETVIDQAAQVTADTAAQVGSDVADVAANTADQAAQVAADEISSSLASEVATEAPFWDFSGWF